MGQDLSPSPSTESQPPTSSAPQSRQPAPGPFASATERVQRESHKRRTRTGLPPCPFRFSGLTGSRQSASLASSELVHDEQRPHALPRGHRPAPDDDPRRRVARPVRVTIGGKESPGPGGR